VSWRVMRAFRLLRCTVPTIIDNFIHRKQTIEHTTNQIKLNNS